MAEKLQVWIVTSNRGSATVEYLNHKLQSYFGKHPGVEVEWRLLSWSTAWIELLRAYKQGSPPDICEFGTTWVGMLAHLGALSPVPVGVMRTLPMAPYLMEVSHHRGVQYSVPWLADSTCFLGRSDILQQLDIDPLSSLSWNDFHSACQTIATRRESAREPYSGLYPKSMSFSCRPERVTMHRIFPWLWAGGFNLPDFSQSDVRVLTSPQIFKGLDYVRNLMCVGDMTLDEARSSPHHQNESFFIEGRHAFLVTGWFSAIRRIAENNPLFEAKWPTQVMRFPSGPNGPTAYGGGSCLGVSPQCQHKDLAWDLVQALIQPELLENWSLWAGAPPAYPCSFWDKYGDTPTVRVLKQTLLEAKTYPSHPVWASFERTLVVGLSELLWYLVKNDFDDQARAIATTVDEELNGWLRLAWEVQP